ncbi:MAG: hypothetical protein AAF710_12325 [Planctomycetota bacterium]
MSETRESKIKKLYEFARRFRTEGAEVAVKTERGEEVHQVKPDERGKLNWEKVEGPSASDVA